MPVQKFRSIEEARKALRVEPETLDHARAVRSVFGIASLLGPARRLPPGVYKFRSVEEAQRQRRAWRSAPWFLETGNHSLSYEVTDGSLLPLWK